MIFCFFSFAKLSVLFINIRINSFLRLIINCNFITVFFICLLLYSKLCFMTFFRFRSFVIFCSVRFWIWWCFFWIRFFFLFDLFNLFSFFFFFRLWFNRFFIGWTLRLICIVTFLRLNFLSFLLFLFFNHLSFLFIGGLFLTTFLLRF